MLTAQEESEFVRIEREAILSAESNENSNDIVAGNSRDNLAAETNNHAVSIVIKIIIYCNKNNR